MDRFGERAVLLAAWSHPQGPGRLQFCDVPLRALSFGTVGGVGCDGGPARPSVMDRVRRPGWGHVLRLQKGTRVKMPDGRVVSAGDLVKRRGRRWQGVATIFKKAGRRDARLTVVWDRRCKEPWIL